MSNIIDFHDVQNALLPVPFRNTTLFVTDINGQPFTPIKKVLVAVSERMK